MYDFGFREDELSTEVSWIVTYLSALSQNATSILVRNGIIPLLVENLQKSKSLNSIIPVIVYSCAVFFIMVCI